MRSFIIISIVLIFAAAVYPQTAHIPSEFESWNEVQLIAPVKHGKDAKGKTIEKLTVTFNGVSRIGRSSFDFLDDRVGAALDYRVNRHFSLTTATLYRREELVKKSPHFETRIFGGGTVFATKHNFTVRDRNAYEHRFRNSRADLNVYRQKIQASYSFKRNGKELFAPFVADEGFYNLKLKTWFRNEFYAGITRKLSKQTSLDIAYIRTDTRPVNVNGLNLILKIKLR
ncbi:MAG: DUF2490 domain-containing protein [Acidobacteriota bacterium]|nr:DUF2490 domain-containing protein [Acidobacteriota bacterium]